MASFFVGGTKRATPISQILNSVGDTAIQTCFLRMYLLMSVCRMEIAIKRDMDVQELKPALATWLRWLECQSVHQKFAGSIPSQGTCLGRGFHPLMGWVQEATSHQCFCISLSSSLPPSFLSSLKLNGNMSLGEDKKTLKPAHLEI